MIIAGSAVRPILSAMQVTPYFIWDDMYLIGLCAVKAKVQLRTSNRYVHTNIFTPCISYTLYSRAFLKIFDLFYYWQDFRRYAGQSERSVFYWRQRHVDNRIGGCHERVAFRQSQPI